MNVYKKKSLKRLTSFLLSIALLMASTMGLILSIPIKSKADAGYNAFAEFTKTYNNATYGFSPVDLTDLPSGYSFNPNVINYVIERAGTGFGYTIGNKSGFLVEEWIHDQTNTFVNWVFGSIVNAYIATASFVQDYVYTSAEAYRWYYSFTGADESYPGWDTYGTAYGFRFEGICGDIIDLVLDSEGNFYGLNPLGNIILDQQEEPYEYIRIHQGNDVPTDPTIYAPSVSVQYFSDLKPPYIEGKSLHFFYYYNDTPIEFIVDDFTDTSINATKSEYQNGSKFVWRFYSPYHYTSVHRVDNANVNLIQYRTYTEYHNQNINLGSTYSYVSEISTAITSGASRSYNLPFWNGSIASFGYYNALGFLNDSVYPGSGNIYLKSFSYIPNTNPNPIPENPIPITSIPEDPEDPLPNNPNPDPVPGITYPVNPTPPIFRPLPSIVSGNDELWPSVVELENIEIELGDYIGSLDNYEFPDLSSITSSFAGAIVWVSTIMSTLFNGSDFSILFAVLSSFFIVAALLGLYKWWNHK